MTSMPKKKRLPQNSVVAAHVYVIYTLKEDGSPDVYTQWDGDYPTLLGLLEIAKENIISQLHETRGGN